MAARQRRPGLGGRPSTPSLPRLPPRRPALWLGAPGKGGGEGEPLEQCQADSQHCENAAPQSVQAPPGRASRARSGCCGTRASRCAGTTPSLRGGGRRRRDTYQGTSQGGEARQDRPAAGRWLPPAALDGCERPRAPAIITQAYSRPIEPAQPAPTHRTAPPSACPRSARCWARRRSRRSPSPALEGGQEGRGQQP